MERLLADGVAVGSKELKEYMEVKGYADAARWVYGQALEPGAWTDGNLLTMTEVRHVHRMALTPVWGIAPHPNATERASPGNFREHDIEPFPGGIVPPSWVEVPPALSTWLEEVSDIAHRERPIEALAAAHGAFERIHPFLDGNGRAGRLLLNLLLVRLGYAPAIIYTRDRHRYLRALRSAGKGTPARSANCSPARCSTTCTDSSSRPSRVRTGSTRLALANTDPSTPVTCSASHKYSARSR